MIRFAVIGTNSISDTFMDAAREVAGFSLGAVYSRTLEHGQAFADRYGARCVYTSLEELAAASDIDAVYIASPNSCHCKQTIQMLEGKKHVLCEKPIASDLEELRQMLEAAKRNHVVLLEAMRSVFDPGFAKLQELLPRLGTLRHVAFQYCQYSSRYDKFKEGMVMNAFNPLLSNAALMDIGVYCVHPMVKLFGMPQKISADSIFLSNGMEGMGTVIADYGAMQAVLVYSKIVNSYLPSQIEGEAGSMLIREISEPKEIELYLRNGDHEVIKIDKKGNNMYYEIMEFLRLIENGEDGSIHNQYSLYEMEVMDEVRKCAGIDFSVKTL